MSRAGDRAPTLARPQALGARAPRPTTEPGTFPTTMANRYKLLARWPALVLAALLLAAAPVVADAPLEEVRALDARGRTREALQALEGLAPAAAATPAARLLRGVLLAKLGRTAEARQLYQALIRDHPQLPEAYNNLAVMHAAAGDYDAAVEILKQGLATHPSYGTTYENLTKVYGKLAGEAYSKALGDERIDAEPLRLALINEMAAAPPAAAAAPAAREREAATRPAQPPSAPVREPVAAVREPLAGEPARAGREGGDQEVWQMVEAWAAAWAGQKVDDYLSFYAEEFAPADGSSRADWQAVRRQRLEEPEFIEISLALLEVSRPESGRAVARFVQSYSSDRFSDTVTKALELVKTDQGWRIIGERVEEQTG